MGIRIALILGCLLGLGAAHADTVDWEPYTFKGGGTETAARTEADGTFRFTEVVPGRYDLVVDMVGNHSPRRNLRVLEPSGTFVLVGGGKGNWIEPIKRPLQVLMLSPFVDREMESLLARLRQEDLVTLADLMESRAVTPVIDRRYPLRDVASAIEYSETGRARGKIIVNVR